MSSDRTPAAPATRPIVGVLQWFRPGERAEVRRTLSDLKELGVAELRTGVSWADYFAPGGREWYDWLIPTVAREVRVLPCFLYTPPSLGERPKTSSPPRELKAYADFVDEAITRWGEHFEWVELWNEPNNRTEYDFALDYGWFKFAEMVGGAAHWAQQRGKKTVLGGMSPIDPNWLEEMFERGVMQYIDAVGIHGFPDVFDQQWDGWDVNVAAVREVLDRHGSAAELWITEAGFSTWQHDELKQVRELERVLQAGVDRVYWYSLFDLDLSLPTVGGLHVDEREYHFGLKRTDGSPKLLYRLWARHGARGLRVLPHLRRDRIQDRSEPYTLITGGAGFIGTNLASRLLEDGERVLVFDNLARPGAAHNLRWLHETYGDRLEVYIGDIRDLATVKLVMRRAARVFHLAAQVAVTTSLEAPTRDFEVNALGTLNILEAIRAHPDRPPLVFTSTNKVYGDLQDLRFTPEDTRYQPTDAHVRAHGISERRALDFHSPYGCSKGTADQYVLDYARSFGLQTVVFRMSCIYGPHQHGTEDQGWVAHFAIRAIEDRPINIYGDGKQVRDVLFVDDLVEAFRLAQRHMPRISGRAFNIGGGVENTVSLLELVATLGEYGGEEIDLSFGDWRTGDQHYYVSDIRAFEEATGWYPRHRVGEGLARLYQWLCERRGIEMPEPLLAAYAEPGLVAPSEPQTLR